MTTYPIVLSPDNGTLLATCPDLPEVTSFGEDERDTLLHARDAVEEALAARLADWRDFPRPSPGKPSVSLPALSALKIELYWALQEARITRAELARQLAWNRESVDRLFRLDHRSRLDQIEAAFAVLSRSLSFNVKEEA